MANDLDRLISDLKKRRNAIDVQINTLQGEKTTGELIDKLRELRGRAETTSRAIGPDDETLRLPRR